MDEPDTKKLLWENVTALMLAAYGAENLTRLAREAEFGPGTSTRIKEAKTSVGIDVLEKLARLFKVNAWQLIAPKLGAGLFTIDNDRRVTPISIPAPHPRGSKFADTYRRAHKDAPAPAPDKKHRSGGSK